MADQANKNLASRHHRPDTRRYVEDGVLVAFGRCVPNAI